MIQRAVRAASGPAHRWQGAEVPYERPAPRQLVPYVCDRGHEFEVVLSAGAEVPGEWDCRCGALARLPGTAANGPGESEHDRCMRLLLLRHTPAQLGEILAEQLAEMAAQREGGTP